MPRITPQALRVLTEERRKQILDAAAKVFGAKGYESATVADIAREAGVAEGSIYNYFKNKEDLLITLPRQIAKPIIESFGTHMTRLVTDGSVSPEQVLKAIAREMIVIFRQNAYIFRILISALPRMKQTTRRQYVDQVIIYVSDALESYFRKLVEHSVFRRDLDTKIAVRYFIDMIVPMIMLREVLQMEDSSEWDYDQFIAAAVPLFLHGVMSTPEERTAQ